MKHTIPLDGLGPTGQAMIHAVEKCVHCGFCLPACPTYTVLGEEMDSPRGRILLMKSVLEGTLILDEAFVYIDRCLGCLGCVTACPSGVPYGDLITSFRNYAKERRRIPVNERIAKWVVGATLPHPTRFRLSASAGSFAKIFNSFIPKKFSAMLEMLPESIPPTRPLPEVFPAKGKRRARVALLAGCVQQVLAPEINWATLRVLANNGIEVLIPPGQSCCGALAIHTGEFDQASEFAIHNLQTFPRDVDAILTNAAGCGSGMHEYPLLFQGDDLVVEIDSFSKQVQDVCQFLDDLGVSQPLSLPVPIKIAYQDACHLAHAQGITTAPRHLLEQISNLTLLTIPEGELCCGSAGTYNLEHPEIATALGRRKVENILSTGAQTVVSGNIGCMVQMRKHFIELGKKIPVLHTMELLDQAYKTSNMA